MQWGTGVNSFGTNLSQDREDSVLFKAFNAKLKAWNKVSLQKVLISFSTEDIPEVKQKMAASICSSSWKRNLVFAPPQTSWRLSTQHISSKNFKILKKNTESKWLRSQGLVAKQSESFVHGRGISRHQSHLRCRFDLSGRRDVANLKCKTSRSCHGERPESAKAPSLVMLRL